MDRVDNFSLILFDDYLHDNTNTSTTTSNTTTSEPNNNHAAQNDNNVSFNTSSLSSYSAEEEIIQQRGRRSPMKNSSNNNQHHQLQQLNNNCINTRDLFLNIKQKSMQSPDSKSIDYNNTSLTETRIVDLSQDIVDASQLSSNLSSIEPSSVRDANLKKCKRNLNRSLLRTPVKRRLRLRRQSSGYIRKLIRHY